MITNFYPEFWIRFSGGIFLNHALKKMQPNNFGQGDLL
jgi:hypothetical protein